jgi:hypothetical protein
MMLFFDDRRSASRRRQRRRRMSRHLPPNDTPIQLIKPLFLPLL